MSRWLWPASIAFLCWGFWAVLPKLSTRYIDPKSAMVFQTLGVVLVAVVVLISLNFKPVFHVKGFGYAVLTGILGFCGALAYLYAASKGPIILVSTLTALYPLLAIIVAAVFLNEPVSIKQGMGILLGLIAIGLIASEG